MIGDRRFDREIARLAGPALITLLAEPAYLLVDTAVVGRLGTAQLAGLAVASSVLLMVYSLSIFLAYGTTASVARLLGAGRERQAAHQAVQGLWLAVGVGVTSAVLIGIGARGILGALGAQGDVATHALLYLRISLFGLPMLLVTLAGTGYLRGLQDTRTPLIVSLGTAAINIVLELVLVVWLGYGIGASALSTVIAQVAGGVVYVMAVVRPARAAGARLRPSLATQRGLVRVGLDLVLRTAALRGSLLVLTTVAVRIGDDDVAAHQIAFEVWNLLAFGLDALAIAAQAMIGRHLGAGRASTARAVASRLLVLGCGASAATTAVVALTAPWLPGLFTTDPEVASLTTFLLWWVAGLQVVGAVAFVLDGVLIGAGDQRFLARAMVVSALLMAAAVAPILPLGLGIGWLWAAFAVLMISRAVVLGIRFRGSAWLRVGPASPVNAS